MGTYPGVVIPLSQNVAKLQKHPQCEAYIWRFSDNAFVIDPTNEMGMVNDVCLGGRDGLPGSQWLFRNVFRTASVPTTLCRINEPPLGKDVNVVTDEDLQGRFVTFSLERNVAANEVSHKIGCRCSNRYNASCSLLDFLFVSRNSSLTTVCHMIAPCMARLKQQ